MGSYYCLKRLPGMRLCSYSAVTLARFQVQYRPRAQDVMATRQGVSFTSFCPRPWVHSRTCPLPVYYQQEKTLRSFTCNSHAHLNTFALFPRHKEIMFLAPESAPRQTELILWKYVKSLSCWALYMFMMYTTPKNYKEHDQHHLWYVDTLRSSC